MNDANITMKLCISPLLHKAEDGLGLAPLIELYVPHSMDAFVTSRTGHNPDSAHTCNHLQGVLDTSTLDQRLA